MTFPASRGQRRGSPRRGTVGRSVGSSRPRTSSLTGPALRSPSPLFARPPRTSYCQFLPSRLVSRWMPNTSALLQGTEFGERFVGIARPRRESAGVVHSDRRNCMLCTCGGATAAPGHTQSSFLHSSVLLVFSRLVFSLLTSFFFVSRLSGVHRAL